MGLLQGDFQAVFVEHLDACHFRAFAVYFFFAAGNGQIQTGIAPFGGMTDIVFKGSFHVLGGESLAVA
jgi:hypothetical protein